MEKHLPESAGPGRVFEGEGCGVNFEYRILNVEVGDKGRTNLLSRSRPGGKELE